MLVKAHTPERKNVAFTVAVDENRKDFQIVNSNQYLIQSNTPFRKRNKTLFESKSNNYLASVIVSKSEKNAALSICDISTGELYASEINSNLENQNEAIKEIINELTEEIIRFSPKEIMTIESVSESIIIKEMKNKFSNIFYSTTANYTAEYSYAYKTLTNHFKTVSLKSFGIEEKPLLISLLGSTIFYIQELSKTSLEHISNIKLYNRRDSMTLD